jgi:hypothetical protein
MGQAKLRGSKEDRIAQSKEKILPPKEGLYISTKSVKELRIIVENVTVLEDEEDEGFFLVEMIDEASSGDFGAMGDELTPDQWFDLVEEYGLVYSEN